MSLSVQLPPEHRTKLWLGAVLMLFLALSAFWGARPRATLAFLDVGQGDSIFLQTREGATVLVDTGPGAVTLDQLGGIMGYFRKTIDLMVLTHPHQDHTGGAPEILRRYSVRNLLITGVASGEPSYTEALEAARKSGTRVLVAGDTPGFQVSPSLFLEVVFPFPGESLAGTVPLNANDTSIVLRGVERTPDGVIPRFLLMGDAEEGLEARLLGSGSSLRAPVLKVGHHGSRTASSPAFLEAVQPGLAVISLGAENRFGFPHEATMTALRNITGSNPSSGVHRTDLEGTIEIEYGKIPLM